MPPHPTMSPLNIVRLDIPGQKTISPSAINNHGQVVGFFTDAAGTNHGFLYDAGAFTPLDYPGAAGTKANGINNLGQIVGSFQDKQNTHGFTYSSGQFSPPIGCPGNPSTEANGINDSGLVVGSGTKGGGSIGQGFIYDVGNLTLFHFPTPAPNPTTVFQDIDDGGQVVGFFWLGDNNHGVSYLYNPGVFTLQVDYPYGGPPIQNGTTLQGINNCGQIVGTFRNPSIPLAFVFNAGKCYQLMIPGANAASASGINDHGQVVGFFSDASGEHGYIAALAL
jgi:probable HAF family extracellular repeat protein